MPKRRKVRGPRDPTEAHHFSVTRCDFWTNLHGGTPRDDTGCSASVTFYGILSTPIRATTAIEIVVYLKDEQSYRSIDEAPAYVGRTTQKSRKPRPIFSALRAPARDDEPNPTRFPLVGRTATAVA